MVANGPDDFSRSRGIAMQADRIEIHLNGLAIHGQTRLKSPLTFRFTIESNRLNIIADYALLLRSFLAPQQFAAAA